MVQYLQHTYTLPYRTVRLYDAGTIPVMYRLVPVPSYTVPWYGTVPVPYGMVLNNQPNLLRSSVPYLRMGTWTFFTMIKE